MVFLTLTKLAIVAVFGLLVTVGGVVIFFILPNLISSQVKQNFQLKNGTEGYKMWEEIPIPLFMDFYLFNVTNADDILNFGAKPKLEQVGPYSYKETRKKVDIVFNEDFSAVSYKQIRIYHFDDERSAPEDDLIVFPNVPLITATKMAAEMPGMEGQLKSSILAKALPKDIKLFVRKTARELLFDGYYEPVVDSLQKIIKQNLLPNGMFALYYGKNGTDDGIYKVNTGLNDMSHYSNIIEYNNSKTLSVWKPNSTCNMINGTDGNQNPPNMKKEDKLYLFMSELCRSINLDYEKETEVAEISTYHYELPFNNLLDPTLNPDNDCFCLNGLESCSVSGLLDVSKCNLGAPIMFGLPHFLLSDPMLFKQVDGLSPNKEKHLAFLDVEPITGVPLKAARRIQVNVQMVSRPLYAPFEISKMPDMVFPMLWVNENVEIDKSSADKLKDMMINPLKIAHIGKYVLIAFGVVVVIAAIVLIVRRRRIRSRTQLQLNVITEEIKFQKF